MAYISGDMTRWENTIDKMESKTNKSNAFMLELVNFQYGYIAWCLNNEQAAAAKEYLAKGEEYLKILEQNGYQLSMVFAYRSAFYGFGIMLNILKAPFYGPKNLKYARQSVQLDANNPLGYVQLGNRQYYMPEAFGGSKSLALEYYQKAEKLFEKKASQIKEDWNYLNVLVMMAQIYDRLNDLDSAKRYYEKILTREPEFRWVKDLLYPRLLDRMRYNRE